MLRFCLFLSMIFLNSCATKVTSIKTDENIVLERGKGFVLLGIETDRTLKQITISGPRNIILTSKDLKRGSNYLFVDLPAGTYTIDRIFFNYSYRMSLKDEEKWKFRVLSNEVTYVGHFEIAVRRSGWWPVAFTELVNRSSEAIEFMEERFPTVFQNNSMSYGGPGNDDFISFITNRERNK